MLIEAPTRLRAAASDLESGQSPDGASPSLTWFIADSGAGPLGLGVPCGAAAPPHAAAAAVLLADAEPVPAALDIAQGEPLAWSWVAQPHAPAPGPSSGLVLRSRTDPATCVHLPWAWWRARQSRAHAVADWAEAFEWPEVPATLRAGRLRLSAQELDDLEPGGAVLWAAPAARGWRAALVPDACQDALLEVWLAGPPGASPLSPRLAAPGEPPLPADGGDLPVPEPHDADGTGRLCELRFELVRPLSPRLLAGAGEAGGATPGPTRSLVQLWQCAERRQPECRLASGHLLPWGDGWALVIDSLEIEED